MFAFHRAPGRAYGTGTFARVSVICLAALLGACSSSKQPDGPQVFVWLQPEPPPPVPVATAQELEDDGLPSQTPPPAGIRNLPDDPTAPWSPNYGRSAAGIRDVASPQAHAGDSWQAVTRPAVDAVPGQNSDGLPVPKSPDDVGRAVPGKQASLQEWPAACAGWKCAR